MSTDSFIKCHETVCFLCRASRCLRICTTSDFSVLFHFVFFVVLLPVVAVDAFEIDSGWSEIWKGVVDNISLLFDDVWMLLWKVCLNEGWGGRWSKGVSVDESAVLSVAEHAGVTNDSLKPHCQHSATHTYTQTRWHTEAW